MAWLPFDGRPHIGLVVYDDARNTAVLVRRGGFTAGSLPLPLPAAQAAAAEEEGVVVGGGGGGGGARVRYCHCGVESREKVVRRPGPTQGRRFFGCGRWTAARGAACDYYVWDEAAPSTFGLNSQPSPPRE
uniref:GRF-type domain-containing protein n=1 Tax=Oryza glaberrima TaxID=4538 RepID=I1R0L3_ORYGL